MLYDFHRNENAKKPQSVHATYVISGFQKPPAAETPVTNGHAKDEDEVMQSSPYLPSSMPNQDASFESPRVMSIIIAREEDLEGTLGTTITADGRGTLVLTLGTVRRREINLPLHLDNPCVQPSTYCTSRSQYIDRCVPGNCDGTCAGRSFGMWWTMGHDSESQC